MSKPTSIFTRIHRLKARIEADSERLSELEDAAYPDLGPNALSILVREKAHWIPMLVNRNCVSGQIGFTRCAMDWDLYRRLRLEPNGGFYFTLFKHDFAMSIHNGRLNLEVSYPDSDDRAVRDDVVSRATTALAMVKKAGLRLYLHDLAAKKAQLYSEWELLDRVLVHAPQGSPKD